MKSLTVNAKFPKLKEEHTRENFFGKHPEALKLVKGLSDEEIYKLNRGGHDPYMLPMVKQLTIKELPQLFLHLQQKVMVGSREADTITHQVKKLSLDNIKILETDLIYQSLMMR